MKATATAPSNIAFIKYWGKKDEVLRLPENGSISMNLSGLETITTVEFDEKYTTDEIIINDTKETNEGSRAIKHLDRVRDIAKLNLKAKVVTNNNFPTGTGLSSSASGFAAISVAAASAAGLQLSEKELSILARQGSGSACRSIPSGIVEWIDGDTSETSYAVSLYPPDYWDIVDTVAVVNEGRKEVATTVGQKLTGTSPFFQTRLSGMQQKLKEIKQAMKDKDFTKFGEILEAEALNMHAVMLTSQPSLIYWTPGTLRVMRLVSRWRKEGTEVYFSINTGQDIHLISKASDALIIQEKLKIIVEVKNIISNTISLGTLITENHLF